MGQTPPRKFVRIVTGAVTRMCAAVVIGLLLVTAPAQAQQDNCDQCKYLRCLKSSVARKEKLIAVYEGLRTFWLNRTTDANGKPIAVKELSSLAEPERSRVFRALSEQLKEYAKMEDSRTGNVPAAEGCGYGEQEQSAETDSFEFCTTKRLAEAKAAQPCKEMAQLIEAHEGTHAAACKARQKPANAYWPYVVTDPNGKPMETKYFPPKMITPAGLAAEEITAYRAEVTSLQKIIDKLEPKCRKITFKNVTIDCVMGSGAGKVRIGQKIEGRACGDPTKTTWTMKQTHFMEGAGLPPMPQNTDEFDSDCVEAGGDIEKHYADTYRRARTHGGGGWMCVYRAQPKPQITVRSFRLPNCEGAAEQTVTVDAELGERCDEEKPLPTPPSVPVS